MTRTRRPRWEATAAIWEAVTTIRVAIMSGTMSAVVPLWTRAAGR